MRSEYGGVLVSTISPNMNLVLSTVAVDSGLNWENNLNSSLTLVDSHNHTAGQGVQIPTAAININAALPFNNYQATNLQATVFTNQTSLSTVNALYVVNSELWYNDSAGAVQLTNAGSPAQAVTSIVSGSASAAFSSGVLQVYSNTSSTTPGSVSMRSALLGLNSAASNYLTLSPPSALSSGGYTLVLPTIPSAQSFLQIDTGGNITAGVATSGGITTSNISSSAGILGSQLSSSANITGSQLSSSANIAGSQLSSSAGIVGGQLVSNIDLQGASVQQNGRNLVSSAINTTTGLAIVRGYAIAAGGLHSGEGFTVTRLATGSWSIAFTTAFTDVPAIVVSAADTTVNIWVYNPATTGCIVDATTDSDFMFIAIGQHG